MIYSKEHFRNQNRHSEHYSIPYQMMSQFEIRLSKMIKIKIS